MKKKNFVLLVAFVLSGMIFALGMCMCLLPQWQAFEAGVVLTALGVAALLALALACWRMAGKPRARINWKMAGKVAYCVVAALTLGTGMAMIMAYEGLMVWGVAVGMAGLLLGLGIIPLVKGLK